MKFGKTIIAGVFAAAALTASYASAATMVTFGDPWGQKSTLDSAMDDAFGAGSWNDLSSPTGTSFLTGESFVYLEGGDSTADEMEAFINSNAAALTSWVNAGGSLFINAAPNEGDGLSFGVFDLVYPGDYCNLGCDAVDPLNPIFDGAGTSFGGNSFSHGYVEGGTSLITNTVTGVSVLSEVSMGSGFLMMGSMTTTNYHSGDDPQQLRSNILAYAAAGGVSAAVPLPAAGWMLIAGLGGMAAFGRRKKAA